MNYYFSKKYKKYYDGGNTTNSQSTLNGAMGLANTASGIIDAYNQPDTFGHKSVGATTGSDALKGAALGTTIMPGWGTLIGGVVGAGYGYISSTLGNKKAEGRASMYMGLQKGRQQSMSDAMIAQDPALVQGNQGAGYYAGGGYLTSKYLAQGGSLSPMNSDGAMEVQGDSHEEGGVQLPEQEAEVEGGETIHDGFVFSKRLGFAQEDKKLEKAIGTIESKGPQTVDRRNSIQRMQERREQLKQSQEMYKHVMEHFGLPLKDVA